MKTKIKANEQSEESDVTTSAYGYNPIYQKRTKLTWDSPSGGYSYFGPPPDVGTSYGTWWDEKNSFGIIAPIFEEACIYSPQSGEELQYEGPASADAVYALLNFKGSFEFLPPTTDGDTCLTSASIFSKDVQFEAMYNPFTGAEITQEYNTMKANRTTQPAGKPAGSAQAKVNKPTAKPLTPEVIDAMTEDELSANLMSMLSKTTAKDKEEEEKSAGDETEVAPSPEDSATDKAAEAPPPAPEGAPPAGDAPPAPAMDPALEAPPATPDAAPPAPPADAPPATPPADGAQPPAAPAPQSAPPPAPGTPPAGGDPNALPPPLAPPAGGPTPEAPPIVPEVPLQMKEEPPTPTTKEGQQGVESMNTAEQKLKLQSLALKLLNDPEYVTKNPAEVKAMLAQANGIIEAAKKESSGFYQKAQQKALDEAQRKLKPEGNGFYSDTIDSAREKALKEIDKVSAMLDAKLKAVTADAPPAVAPEAAPVATPPAAAPAAPVAAPAAADAWNLQGGLSKEDLEEMSSAMAAIEKALSTMTAGKSGEAPPAKEKSKSKSKPMPPKSAKEKSKSKKDKSKSKPKGLDMSDEAKANTDSMEDFSQLKAEIEALEAALKGEMGAQPPMQAPMAADAPMAPAPEAAPPAMDPMAPPADPLAPVPNAAESVAVELISSAAEVEAEGITAGSIKMDLFGEAGLNPFYNITANGEPIARVHLQDQADPQGDRAFFLSAKYSVGVAQAIEKVGLQETLKSINAKFFANRIERTEMVKKVQAEADKVIKAQVAQKTAALRDELVDRMVVAQAALDKNMYKEEGNPLKEAMFLQFQKFGVKNPLPYVEAACEAGLAEHYKLVIAKAIELMDMEPKAYEQIKRTVANSDVLAVEASASSTEIVDVQPTMTLSAHFASQNVPLSFTHDNNDKYTDTRESIRASLSLGRKI